MSHLSNFTNDNITSTRLLCPNAELFLGNCIDNCHDDAFSKQQNSNHFSYKYNQGSYLFNNPFNNSNFTFTFEQNSVFAPFNRNDNSRGSMYTKSFKRDDALLENQLIKRREAKAISIAKGFCCFGGEKGGEEEMSALRSRTEGFDLIGRLNQTRKALEIAEPKFHKRLKGINIDLKFDFNETDLKLKDNRKSIDGRIEKGHYKIKKKPFKGIVKTSRTSKPNCKCNKSKCLQYYCECFSKNAFCKDCQCKCCLNTEKNINERNRAILLLSIKNQGKTPINHSNTSYQGCKCFKSHCQKKYCECYNKGIACSLKCRCFECKNTEQNETISNLSKQLNEKNFTNQKRERANELLKAKSSNNNKETTSNRKKFLIDKNISQMFNQMLQNERTTNPSLQSTNP